MADKQEYPKWVYHADGRSALVKDEDARKALGSNWTESPPEKK